MKKKFAILLALFLIAVVCSAGCIDPEDPVDPIDPVDPVDPVDPITPVDPVDPVVPTEEYSVMFMLNYGDAGAYTAETVKAGETVSKPASPTRSGYTFNGWFTAAEGGAAYDFTQPVNADVTLYAQWKKKSSSSSGGSSAPSTPTTPDTSCSHNWGVGDGWVEVNPATCTAPGLKERVCTLCSESETQEIPKLNHNMGAEVVLVPATCVEAGTNVSVCDYGCGETKTIPVVALGHKDSDTDSDTLCDLCGSDLAEPDEGDLHEHIYVLQSVEGNVGTLECNCGDTKTETYVAQVAGKYYTNLAWAIDNASVENVLVLLEDANSEIPKKVAINLNGKNATFTYDNINNVTILSPKGEGTLEVTADGKTVVFGEKVVADNLLPVIVAYTKVDTRYSTIDIYTEEGLMWTSTISKDGMGTSEGRGCTINIMTNLDMTGLDYYPINSMWITIDGNGNIISNLDCLRDNYVGRSGFLAYAGACTIKDLTLHNVKATGTQVGAFAGSAEALILENCKLTGTVELTWEQNPEGSAYQETWNGIGAVAGVSTSSAGKYGVVLDGAQVTIKMNGMTTEAPKVASFPIVGYIENANLVVANVLKNDAKITVIYADGFQSIHTATETSYEISNLNGLKYFRDSVNAGETYNGKIVKLTADIDLGNEAWTPIGTSDNNFEGTFDGQDKTISNLAVNDDDGLGLFGYVHGKITNVKVKNADISGSKYLGGIVGYIYGSVTDCSVEHITLTATPVYDGSKYDAGAKVGGIVGYVGDSGPYSITGNSVKDVTITAYREAGGIIGFLQYGTKTIADNHVDGLLITISRDGITPYDGEPQADDAGEIIGDNRFTGTITGCTAVNVVIIGSSGIEKETGENGEVIWSLPATEIAAEDTEAFTDFRNFVSNVDDGDTVTLGANVEGTAGTGGYGTAGISPKAGSILDGNGQTLTVNGADSTWACAIYTTGGTIKDLTVNGAFRGIFTAGCSTDIIVEDCVIDDVCYTFSSDGSNPHKVTFIRTTLNGWTSYTSGYKAVSFIGCNFGKGTGGYQYAYCRPYSDSTFTSCVFEEGYEFDATRCTNTFINCYVGETLITQDNVVTLLGDDAAGIVVTNT